ALRRITREVAVDFDGDVRAGGRGEHYVRALSVEAAAIDLDVKWQRHVGAALSVSAERGFDCSEVIVKGHESHETFAVQEQRLRRFRCGVQVRLLPGRRPKAGAELGCAGHLTTGSLLAVPAWNMSECYTHSPTASQGRGELQPSPRPSPKGEGEQREKG